jgi:putative transcriptional regulator
MGLKFISPLMTLRQKAALNQSELAEILGVSKQTISNWEVGRKIPTLTIPQTKALCKALGVTLDDLPDSFAPQPIYGDLGVADE